MYKKKLACLQFRLRKNSNILTEIYKYQRINDGFCVILMILAELTEHHIDMRSINT